MKKVVLMLMAVAAVTACKNMNKASQEAVEAVDSVEVVAVADAHNSQNSIDFVGTYKGTLPCADCQGIETTLVIGNDTTFTRTMKYLGKKENSEFVETGKYKWNAEGAVIELEGLSTPAKYQVAEGKLVQLDQEGKAVTGELAESYVLVKQQ